MKYKAYIKTIHMPTPIHFLGVTAKEDVDKIIGVSKHFDWLQEDFPDLVVTTRIVFECDDLKLFNRLITNYSFALGPENLRNYANQVPQTGFADPDIPAWIEAMGITKRQRNAADFSMVIN